MGKGGLACAAPFPKSCAQIGAQDSGCFFYNRSDQQNFKITKFIVDYYMSPAQARVLKYGSRLRLRLRRGRRLRLTKDINIFLTACGRVKSGLKPAVKNRAAHGGEDCAARRVKTKADALVIGGLIYRVDTQRNLRKIAKRYHRRPDIRPSGGSLFTSGQWFSRLTH